jgi:hypothetical protein
MVGQVVYRSQLTAHSGSIDEHVQLDGSLANGMYILNLNTGSENKVFHFVVEQ